MTTPGRRAGKPSNEIADPLLVDPLLEVACTAVSPRWTGAYRTAPIPGQQRIVDEVLADCQKVGRVPRFQLHWFDHAPNGSTGRTRLLDDGSIVVEINAGLAPEELRRVLFHEVAHVCDFRAGRGRREQAAISFERRMMAARPAPPAPYFDPRI